MNTFISFWKILTCSCLYEMSFDKKPEDVFAVNSLKIAPVFVALIFNNNNNELIFNNVV